MITPIRPMNRKLLNDVKSRLVVYPYKLMAPKVAAVIKKVLAMDAWVYTRKIKDKVKPLRPA